jgi:hypothetical protein
LDWFQSLPQKLLFEPWEPGFFESAFWSSTMHGVLLILALCGILLLVLEQWLPQFGARVPRRFVKQLSVSLTVLGFFAYFSFFNPNSRFQWFYERHEFFHHYVGAKYFKELGYTHLYECTAVAEVELGKEPQLRGKWMQDLAASNQRVAITDSAAFNAPGECKQRFSEARWEAFRSDISFFEASCRGPYWDEAKLDQGYSASPLWTSVGKWFASLSPASDTSLKSLASLDVLLHAVSLGVLAWGFGLRVAAIGSLFWAVNGVAGFAWTGGAFLRQDWIFLLIASLAFARRGYLGLSGAALTSAFLLRVFPGWLLVGPLLWIGLRWWQTQALAAPSRRFLVGVAAALALLVPLSLLGGGSYSKYAEYRELHASTPASNQVGLAAILAQSSAGRAALTLDDQATDPWAAWRQGRETRSEKLGWLTWGASLLVFTWMAYCMTRLRTFWASIPLGLPLLFTATALPCFGYLAFVCLAPLSKLRRGLGPLLLALAALSQILLERVYWLDDRYVAQSYLFGTAALLTLFALTRRLRRAPRTGTLNAEVSAPAKTEPAANV